MSDQEDHASPSDRSKRPYEDDETFTKSDVDRHHNRAKRQAVPDPKTDTPYAAKSSAATDSEKSASVKDGASTKNPKSEDDEQSKGDEDAEQPAADVTPVSLRAIVTTKDAGVIIGKGGKNVNEIREQSGAKVTISEIVPGAVERILTVTGPLDTVALVSDHPCFASRLSVSQALLNLNLVCKLLHF
jgi:heterogeneous nuclear rnp K-like protein